MDEQGQPTASPGEGDIRDPLAVPEAVREARTRPMSERLAQALSIDSVAVELRAGMVKATRDTES